MIGANIANRLKEVVSKYTDIFSDSLNILTLTSLTGTATCTTTTDHGLTTGDFVTIRNAKQVINLVSLIRTGASVAVVTVEEHNLVDPSGFDPSLQDGLLVEISGATPTEYNGTFKLLTVTDRNNFTFEIATTPVSPATTPGTFLESDFEVYNGYISITVTGLDAFTYAISAAAQVLAVGTMEVTIANRIAWAATPERIAAYFNQDANRVLQNWMFVLVGAKSIYKDDTTATDPQSTTHINEGFFYESQQDFSVFIFIPSKNELLGGFASDLARSLELAILRSLANFQISSDLSESVLQPAIYVGNDIEDYLVAFYVHRYDFISTGYIQEEDTVEVDPGAVFEVVDGEIQDVQDLTFNPDLS